MHDPICTESGDLAAALYASFLPVPSADAFPPADPAEYARDKAPGAIIVKKEQIVLNKGRKRIRLRVTNCEDRPIQVRQRRFPLLSAVRRGYFRADLERSPARSFIVSAVVLANSVDFALRPPCPYSCLPRCSRFTVADWFPLPLHRDEPGSGLRPRQGLRQAA